jgi:hypothetical protein
MKGLEKDRLISVGFAKHSFGHYIRRRGDAEGWRKACMEVENIAM